MRVHQLKLTSIGELSLTSELRGICWHQILKKKISVFMGSWSMRPEITLLITLFFFSWGHEVRKKLTIYISIYTMYKNIYWMTTLIGWINIILQSTISHQRDGVDGFGQILLYFLFLIAIYFWESSSTCCLVMRDYWALIGIFEGRKQPLFKPGGKYRTHPHTPSCGPSIQPRWTLTLM